MLTLTTPGTQSLYRTSLERITFEDRLLILNSEPETGLLVVAGYASVRVADMDDHVIDTNELKLAAVQFMAKPQFRNVMVEHTSLQVGTVLDSFTSKQNVVYTTHVDQI